MKIQRRTVVVITTLAVTMGGGQPAPAAADPLNYAEIAELPAARQAAIMDPLRALAGAANTVGTTAQAGIFSGVRLDAPAGIVHIYLTDPARRATFLAAVHGVDPAADTGLARVERGRYTRAVLAAAGDTVLARQRRAGVGVESVVVPSDGSALRVRAFDVTRVRQALAPAGGALNVPVATVVENAPVGADMSRLRDNAPWIAGEAIGGASTPQSAVHLCTSGLPARRNSDGRSFLITAAHCFLDGTTVFTGWQDGLRNRIGVVTNRDNRDDAIAIDTSSTGTTASREWDGPPGPTANVLDVSGSAYSFDGDLTCQDGYASGIVCGLLVNNDAVSWNGSDGVLHRGVEAAQINGAVPTRGGDSGALVFAVLAGNVRQARGIDSFGGNTFIRWTEAPFIFSTLGMSLAP